MVDLVDLHEDHPDLPMESRRSHQTPLVRSPCRRGCGHRGAELGGGGAMTVVAWWPTTKGLWWNNDFCLAVMAFEKFVQPNIPHFDGHYDHWSMLMENFLRSKEYWQVVEVGVVEPAENVVLMVTQKTEMEALKLKDLKEKNYLFQEIDRSILETILSKESSKEIWDSMKKKYQGSSRVKESKDIDTLSLDELRAPCWSMNRSTTSDEQTLKAKAGDVINNLTHGRGKGRDQQFDKSKAARVLQVVSVANKKCPNLLNDQGEGFIMALAFSLWPFEFWWIENVVAKEYGDRSSSNCSSHSRNVPKNFWPKAVNWSIHVFNRSPTFSVRNMTPEEAWSGRKPTIDHFRIFGCIAYAHFPDEKRKKLDDKGKKCVFLGVSEASKAYKLFNPLTKKIVTSRDVIFDKENT
ncbi:hypothetical protein EZV62_024038 [Acer yangbiense]|uniref:Retroviral polymerase SH3-like domain-containing protein n=1 Tax=Acer yangbiense TaxID=1000413 RepID=A0A5C7H3E2_9ROSI|nr:hypothetical protein EZV62_024038 [Acer yangbiense]